MSRALCMQVSGTLNFVSLPWLCACALLRLCAHPLQKTKRPMCFNVVAANIKQGVYDQSATEDGSSL